MAIEVEFRDGVKPVPNHVAYIMRTVNTSTMTYDEAIKAAETQMARDYLNKAQRRLISTHFREHGR